MAESKPEDLPLALRGAYCPHIDAAGGGHRPAGLVTRTPICDYLLTTVVSGEAELTLDGVIHALPAGATALVPPATPYGVRFLTPVRLLFVHASVIFDPAWRAFAHARHFGLDAPPRARFLQPGPEALWGIALPAQVPRRLRPRAARAMTELVGLWGLGTPAATFAATRRLADLLAAVVEAVRPPDAAPTALTPAERIALAETVAHRRSGVGLSVADLAAIAGYGRAHFSAVFTRLRGVAPGDLLRRLRLAEACDRLAAQDWPISELAEALGYPDASSFTRAFRHAFGLTPSAWRSRSDKTHSAGARTVGRGPRAEP